MHVPQGPFGSPRQLEQFDATIVTSLNRLRRLNRPLAHNHTMLLLPKIEHQFVPGDPKAILLVVILGCSVQELGDAGPGDATLSHSGLTLSSRHQSAEIDRYLESESRRGRQSTLIEAKTLLFFATGRGLYQKSLALADS